MLYRPILRGLLGFVPGLLDFLKERKEKTGTISARYCYSVWLRHLVLLHQCGMKEIPKKIAEIGPGASLGIGLSAMLSGVDIYFAFDIIHHLNEEKNFKVFEELITLFKQKTDIPDDKEFPNIYPKIPSYKFPQYILSDEVLNESLAGNRIERIKKQLSQPDNDLDSTIKITYKVPWYEVKVIQPETIELIMSQAVLEHITELEDSFRHMSKWLKKGGYISHQIDYKAHETHEIWNGHWYYSSLIWKIILKGRAYSINRQPHSTYTKIISNCGFSIIQEIKNTENAGLHDDKHKKKYPTYNDEDFYIKNALIQAVKSSN